MQQLREYQFSKTVALVREKRTCQQAMFAFEQTRRLTRQPYLVAAVKPSYKFDNPRNYQT